ncbi:MFS transporter [Streptomyces sp. NL15-2K]|uniref:MFS transporter n=1 Tax=Streptomyces sp. NL15-2K TaxID=376149 RepID=UPI000FFA048F|nr:MULTISPECIES: MFS transporter [Actinomycetes]WKX10507.1 MFS transporter [Kutzneria buriramensis]GCB47959.1 major facilitator superfamily MFS_1 [Streptomyces sp. NL15-2K]
MVPITHSEEEETTGIETPADQGSVWRNRNFTLLWTGQSLSWIGTQITQLAIPLVAVELLDGSPLQVSMVLAAEFLPALLFGVFAGVWVDRLDRRTVLILTDIGRFLSLLAIPVLHWTGHLQFFYLYASVFLTGTLTVFYNAAYQALVPTVVAQEQLLEANGKLEMSRSIAQGAGPASGGVLVQALTAPVAVVADAATYLASAYAAFRMKVSAPRPERAEGGSFRTELAEGVRVVARHPIQWRLAVSAAWDNFFGAGILALFVYYTSRELDLSALLIGVVLASGVVGAVAASMLLRRFSVSAQPREMIIAGALVRGLGCLLVPLAGGPTALAVLVLCLGQVLSQAGLVTLISSATTWRQMITPNHLLGRVVATSMSLLFGAIPLGAAGAGVLADATDTRTALFVAAVGTLTSAAWMLGLRPAPADAVDERP